MDFKHIEILTHNSFFSSKIIAHFLSGCDNRNIRHESIYLVLPFVYYKDSRDILKNATSKSNLNSLFLNDERGKIALAGLEKRVDFFRSLTQTSLIVASKEFGVEINENVLIETILDYRNESQIFVRDFFKSANYLGKILSKTEMLNTFVKLGLRNIWTAS